ncbi:MAG: ATP-binding cassette domain-containing protein, partial [Spirochaetota bacterium]
MSHHSVEMNNVRFSYPDGHAAVEEVTFGIHHGESVGLIGANGAGKSTLL